MAPPPTPRPYARLVLRGQRATKEGVVEGGAVRAYPPRAPGGRGVDPRAGAPPQGASAGSPPGTRERGPATTEARRVPRPAGDRTACRHHPPVAQGRPG